MHNPYRGGTADVWYSGNGGDRWIEYKWIPSVPKSARVVPKLEALQLRWLNGRFFEGRSVCVVVACHAGAALFLTPTEWGEGIDAVLFRSRLVSAEELAEWISCSVSPK